MRAVPSSLETVWVLLRTEVRAALREKTIVVNSIVIPIVLYPFLFWAMFTGMAFVLGQTEGFVSRVAVVGEAPAQLRRMLEVEPKVDVRRGVASVEAALAAVRAGELDALLEFVPPQTAPLAEGDMAVRLTADDAKERSKAARERLERLVGRYREDLLRRAASERGVSPAAWQAFSLSGRNVASSREMGQFILGLLLPLLFVIMVAVGCFYPAVDATAGERERNTWETTMTLAVPRLHIVVAKYLYVAAFGFAAGMLNVAAMVASMGTIMAPLLAGPDERIEFAVPVAAVPVLALGAVLLALFVAAGMMIFASFARTFKDGQSMVTPFYMLILLPVMFLQVPGLEFSLPLAFVPVVNVAMMVREAVSGVFHWVSIAVAVAVSLATVGGCLVLAAAMLRYEDVVVGSYGGSFSTFVKKRLLRRRGVSAAAEVGR